MAKKNDTFLTNYFADIFVYVLNFRKQLEDGEQLSFTEVREAIEVLFAEAEACNLGPQDELMRPIKFYEDEMYNDAKFAVVAFVDERIISSSWAYKREWSRDLLQKKWFGTTMAGSEFFERVEQIADIVSKEKRDIVEVYFHCLALGFEGVYYDSVEKLQNITKKLYSKMSHYDDVFLKYLYPKLPEKNERKGKEFKLNKTFFFLAYIIGMVGIFVFMIWWFAGSLRDATDFLLELYSK